MITNNVMVRFPDPSLVRVHEGGGGMGKSLAMAEAVQDRARVLKLIE